MQEEELCNIAFPMYICRLTRVWISSENSTTHEECWLILLVFPHSSWTLSHPTGLSAVPVSTSSATLCRPSPITFCEFLCPTPLTFPYPLPVTLRLWAQAFVWFGDRTDKGSSAWWTTYIVLKSKLSWQPSLVEGWLKSSLFNSYYTKV